MRSVLEILLESPEKLEEDGLFYKFVSENGRSDTSAQNVENVLALTERFDGFEIFITNIAYGVRRRLLFDEIQAIRDEYGFEETGRQSFGLTTDTSKDSDDLHAILKRCAAKEHRLIVQKYIPRPLLIRGLKFDIRQWVLVTSVNPLVAWMYSNYYLRFSSRAYTPSDLGNAEVHLTNQSVQKHSEDYNSSHGGKWNMRDLRLFLESTRGQEATVWMCVAECWSLSVCGWGQDTPPNFYGCW